VDVYPDEASYRAAVDRLREQSHELEDDQIGLDVERYIASLASEEHP
jgi:hypothetical protein